MFWPCFTKKHAAIIVAKQMKTKQIFVNNPHFDHSPRGSFLFGLKEGFSTTNQNRSNKFFQTIKNNYKNFCIFVTSFFSISVRLLLNSIRDKSPSPENLYITTYLSLTWKYTIQKITKLVLSSYSENYKPRWEKPIIEA